MTFIIYKSIKLNLEVSILVYVYMYLKTRTSNHVNIIYIRSIVPKQNEYHPNYKDFTILLSMTFLLHVPLMSKWS